MNIVITMAGLGKRFAEVGYGEPKFKIPVCGKTLFEWSMLSLKELNEYSDVNYIFVMRKEMKAASFVRKKMKELGVATVRIIEIEDVTDGQASTALLASDYWKEDEELVIYNIDTYVEPVVIKRAVFVGDGFIPCFDGEGDHWSFVGVLDDGEAYKVTEKERISNHCSIGLYYFKNCKLYSEAYNGYYAGWSSNANVKEKYIAPIYNWMIEHDFMVGICDLPKHKVHCLGTPDEVRDFKRLYGADRKF